MPDLIIKQPEHEPFVHRIDRLKTTIGRSSRNDICINDPFASRLHAEIRSEGNSYYIADLGSVNGTFRNSLRVVGRAPLFLGDRIRIGETEILFVADASALAQSNIFYSDSVSTIAPEATITPTPEGRGTSGILAVIESARTSSAPLPTPVSAPAQAAEAKLAPAITEGRDLLAIISKVGVTLLSDTSLDEIFKQIMDLVFDTIPADRGYLLLAQGPDREMICKVARTRTGPIDPTDQRVQISRSITEKVLSEGASVLTSDAIHDPRFQNSKSIVLRQIRSVMAVPLALGEEIYGMIYLDNPYDTRRFTENDLHVLTIMASVATIKIANARLMEERLKRKRIEEEMAVASEIQLRLQPVAPPSIDGWEITGISFPSREVGGDYYDYIERHNGRIVLTLGDVSGKGVGAALLMASVHAAVRAQSQTRLSVGEIVSEVNKYLYKNSPDNKYVTLFYGELDPASGVITYSNAGHNPPLLVRAGATGPTDITRLDVGGLPVGILPDTVYHEGTEKFEPGDILLIYSDGITESINDREEEFGEHRLIEIIKRYKTTSVIELRDRIEEAISRFAGKAAPVDDMTLVAVKRSKG